MKEYRINIGKHIKEERHILKLTQAKLAKKIDVAPTTITHWENNTRTPSIFECCKLADIFEITLDELVGRT